MSAFDIDLGLKDTHVVITGAAGQIGRVIVRAFLAAGCYVSAFDVREEPPNNVEERVAWTAVDVSNEPALEAAFEEARLRFGLVAGCVAAAGLDLSFIPHHNSICDMPLKQWRQVLDVNCTGTFLTARSWLRAIKEHAQPAMRNVALVIIGSEAASFGVPGNADYASSKAAIQYGLARSLAPEAAMIFAKARVNVIAPGAVSTPQFAIECAGTDARYTESEATTALRRSVSIDAVARACLMLVSETFSNDVTGQILPVDCGKSGRMQWQRNGCPTWKA